MRIVCQLTINTILPIGKERTRPDYDYSDGIELHIFELDGKAQTTVYVTDASIKLNVSAERNGSAISVSLDTLPNGASIVLRNIHKVNSVVGAQCTDTEMGVKLELTSKEISIEL